MNNLYVIRCKTKSKKCIHFNLQSEERGTPSRRSKSEGPPGSKIPNGRCIASSDDKEAFSIHKKEKVFSYIIC